MARIRIVDEWLRSPASPVTYHRTVMVVAEKWAEQRVLMRAFAESRDQIRPTIVLHGVELAISPAGIDPQGSWGIHVQPPEDGRAQQLVEALETAARRMAGSRGNPPRLVDEESTFERKPTNNWAPGTPPDVQPSQMPTVHFPPQAMAAPAGPPPAAAYAATPPAPYPPAPAPPAYGHHAPYFPPAQAAPPVAYVQAAQAATYIPSMQQAEMVHGAHGEPAMIATVPANPGLRKTPVPMMRSKSPTQPHLATPGRTALGWQSGAGAQSAVVRLGLTPAVSQRLARLVNRTVPADFQISREEREVLNAVGTHDSLTARAVAQLIGVADPVGWMEQFVTKLERYGLDIIEPGPAHGGEPTYVLRR